MTVPGLSARPLPEAVLERLARLRRLALAAGLAGAILLLLAWVQDPVRFYRAYLWAYTYWLGLSLGSLAVLMVILLAGGSWSLPVRRLTEAGTATLPLMTVLFLPLVPGLGHLYPWVGAEVAAHPLVQAKAAYLNLPSFLLRAGLYLLSWLVLALLLGRWSAGQDQSGDRAADQRLRALSAVGLLAYGLTVTFAGIDWLMSLEPTFWSSVWGMYLAAGQALSALALAVLAAAFLGRHPPIAGVLTPQRVGDLGNLLFTGVMVRGYLAYSQFVVIWAGNLPEEILWYLRRASAGWGSVTVLLVLLHFLVPFLVLLARPLKRSLPALAAVSGLLLVMQGADIFWLVQPAFHPQGLAVHWQHPLALLALGGLWTAVYLGRLPRLPLVPPHDPRLRPGEPQARGPRGASRQRAGVGHG